jgi:ABC-2 type transport system ATP-binding protein
MNTLNIKHLKKYYKSKFLLRNIKVLDDINISVESGQIYGFLGANGAGKTTTIKCVIGLLHADGGEIEVFGEPKKSVKLNQRIGFLPEQPYFYSYLTGAELLEFSAMLFSIPKEKVKPRIRELIEQVGLKSKEDVKILKYSKGMLQRIGLAQALINDPDLLILDEPFSGLDPIGRKELRDIILNLKKQGKTIFFSSHILHDMEMIVDKVGIIINGVTRKEGNLNELITQTVDSYEIIFTAVDEGILRTNRINYIKKGRDFIAEVKNQDVMNNIVEFIMLNQGRIISVTPVKKTLEDIFLMELK